MDALLMLISLIFLAYTLLIYVATLLNLERLYEYENYFIDSLMLLVLLYFATYGWTLSRAFYISYVHVILFVAFVALTMPRYTRFGALFLAVSLYAFLYPLGNLSVYVYYSKLATFLSAYLYAFFSARAGGNLAYFFKPDYPKLSIEAYALLVPVALLGLVNSSLATLVAAMIGFADVRDLF